MRLDKSNVNFPCGSTQLAYVSSMLEVLPVKGKKRELRINLLKPRRLITQRSPTY